ncbi:MAG TPA: hypothetical protein VGD43_07110 [Micromonospora sp.]
MIRYDEYVLAVALTVARWHRPVWSDTQRRAACRCGADLPCQARERVVRRRDWPGHRQVVRVLAEHPRDTGGFCGRCRMGYGLVRYPCSPVRIAVHTFMTELGDRILDGLR